ncbi:unnamed protein product [Paramecium octaurelia]|uniref:Uncharacterized protein n=1 Tax=Paramecium octaurelia TaxID=43137 RepID=A0A8S1X7G7_PAROT|nr:unnamed protein product [Paramecium octaurelia]
MFFNSPFQASYQTILVQYVKNSCYKLLTLQSKQSTSGQCNQPCQGSNIQIVYAELPIVIQICCARILHVQLLQIVHQLIKIIALVEDHQNKIAVQQLIAKILMQQMEFVLINAKVQQQIIVLVDLKHSHIVVQLKDVKMV